MRIPLAAAIITCSIAPLAAGDASLDHYSHDACLHGRLGVGLGAPDNRFDADTGRNLRNYAPDRMVDHKHMQLRITIPDMNTPEFDAVQTLDFAALATPVEAIRLNAEQLMIESVELIEPTSSQARHFHDGSVLTITFDPPLEPNQKARIVTNYRAIDPVDGLFWTTESDAWPDRPAQIHTQGQPETNRYWYPCHDFPNEQLTTELIVSVPEGYEVISNGALRPVNEGGGRATFHWMQDRPHVNYLVTLIVGKFDTVDVAPASAKVRMPVHVPPGKGHLIQRTYANTHAMLKHFEDVFGEPYPWARYAQTVVWNFGAGGMENTSATTMYDTAVFDDKAFADADLDGLISHELAHQWTGDLITCNTWEHIWLNEGWATYSTALWYEKRDGHEDGYLRRMHQTMRGLAKNDHLAPDADDHQPAMASNEYHHPWEVFRRKANPYPKGSSILHMLRMKLGDEVFYKGVHKYVDRYKYKTAETDNFRQVMEEVSGRSLEQFFDQWCYRAGTPKVRVTGRWDEASKQLKITVEQLQRINADNPAYVFDLPFELWLDQRRTDDRQPVRFTMAIDQRRHEHTIPLDARPAYLLIDPELHVLMDLEADIPDAMLHNQVFTAGRIVPRLDAITALGSRNDPASLDILSRVLVNENGMWYEQQLAAEALGSLKATDKLIEATNSGIDDARPRAKALEMLGGAEGQDNKARAAEVLRRHASDAGESYACRASALESLGKVADKDDDSVMRIFRDALASESQHDRVRVGAIKGLAHLDTRESLEAIAPFAEYGHLSRTRPEAISAMATIAAHDKELVLDTIEPLILDHEARTRRSARQAMATIGDERGVAILDSFIARTRHPVEREDAERLRKELRKQLASE